ncbi:protealysin inhibitor emfourin [Modicisalibacter radicis]|uniref:protealysin inhibitor emfourin n=1 Tax=Halomonas sp. EAR18 TaxID=2518972 RepID=UPI00109C7115|nr:protealysin inhibitor emfourin [Halomonas sp. EAR18]
MSRVDDPHRPRLGPGSRLTIRREGGLAHFPGLAAPRCIEGDKCTPGQRRWLERLLGEVLEGGAVEASRTQAEGQPSGADRRVFRLAIDEPGEAAGGGADDTLPPRWTLIVDETRAPGSLVTLWRHGELGEEP